MALGSRIACAREGHGITQAELCALVNADLSGGAKELTQQALSNLESRDSKSSEFAVRIADALGVSIRWLHDGTGRREDQDWPFRMVKRSRWDACDLVDRGYIEAAISRALDDCEAARREHLSGGALAQPGRRDQVPPKAA
jgi:transcriptional regulator with XRE-family HTH domain